MSAKIPQETDGVKSTSEGVGFEFRLLNPRGRTGMCMKLMRLALPILLLATPLLAQEDGGVSFTIAFANGTSRFHVGEIIPILLTFKASIPNLYYMEQRNYDRSGRLDIEQFHVTPPGRDPLHNYYSLGGFMMGGLGGPRALTADPQTMREDLNEWVTPDHPGHYSLYVSSERISRRGATKDEPVELRSNALEFDIGAADTAWQFEALSSARTTLQMQSSTPEEKNTSRRVLRFLDTPESVKELARLLGSGSESGGWNEIAGLAGSRYQSFAVRELEEQMSAPDTAITSSYLYILAKLKFQLDHEPLPPYPQKDLQLQKVWNNQREAQDKEYAEVQNELYQRTATLASSKLGTARAETVQTLLLRPSREPGDVKPLVGLPAEEAASAFLKLSPDQQWNLLNSFWDRLKVSAMAEPLKVVAQQPNMKHQMLRDLALRRLYELDPHGATPIFFEELRHPHIDNGMFTVNGETLGLLPNETLSEFEGLLLERLKQKESRTRGLDAQLVGRYATKAILSGVRRAYDESAGGWDCITEDGFVLYFLRVDPDFGVKRLALVPSVCMTRSLPTVVNMKRWNEVEPTIIAQMDNPDLNRARQAAETLAKYGSSQAEKAMWDRLSRFHAQWAERETELNFRTGMKRDASEASSFQYGLVEAIGRAQAWVLTDDEVTALENLTLGQERDNVKQWHMKLPVDLNITFSVIDYRPVLVGIRRSTSRHFEPS
jgi:hypothetical protein